MDKIMKSMVKQVEDLVIQLSEKYGFDKAEALEFIMPAGESVRGRPSKPKKKVINKTEMVEDIIKTIMEEGCGAVVANAEAEPVIVAAAVAPEGVLEAPIKKKAAPKKKKAEAPVVEAVALVAPDTVAALIAVESPVVAQAEPIIVAADVAPEGGLKGETPLKKKAAPKKKKAEAEAVVVEPVTEVAVVAQAEPVIVAAAVAEAPIKKKAAPKKKKAEVAVTEVAVVAQAEPVTVASEGGLTGVSPVGLKGDAPLKKKAAPKKKAEAPVAVVEAPKPAPAPKKKKAEAAVVEVAAVAAAVPEPVIVAEKKADAAEGGLTGVSPVGLTGVSPVGLKGGSPLSEEESTAVKNWTCKETGKAYLKSCEDNCDEADCECCGTVYDEETQDQIGHWDGTTIVLAAASDDEEEEGEDIDWP